MIGSFENRVGNDGSKAAGSKAAAGSGSKAGSKAATHLNRVLKLPAILKQDDRFSLLSEEKALQFKITKPIWQAKNAK